MARLFFLAVLLFIAVSSINCDSSEEVLEKVKSKHIRKYLSHNKEHLEDGLGKLEKHCPGVTEKLKEAVKEFQECDDKADDSMTICQAIQTYTLNCTAPLLKVVDDCLPQNAKGIPTLGVKSLLSVSDYLCKQTGESIFELANPCLWEDPEELNTQLDECESKIRHLIRKYKDGDHIPTTSEVCTSITDLRGCIQARATATCKNQKTKDIYTGLFDAAISPCSHINKA